MDIIPNSIERLILDGSAEVAGIDLETGEILYGFTTKMQELDPELYGRELWNTF